jgi:nucleotide-binding universal stress UspA family protein
VIRLILVPLDGSRFAEQALPLAETIARRAGARLRLMSAHEPRPDLTPGLDAPAVEARNLEIRSATQAYLAETAGRLGSLGGEPVISEVIDGAAGPSVAAVVARHRPDLVVMSTHGRGPLSRFWLGSVADHLIRHLSVPLLLVRPPAGAEAGPATIRRVLVALDLSTESASMLAIAGPLARVLEAELTLLHVVEPIVGIVDGALPFPIPVDSSAIQRRKAEAERKLGELAAGLAANGAVGVRVVVGVGAAPTILDEAAGGDHDLVAMTTHGAGGMRRLLVGSVADKVIRGSTRPVLVLRAGG